MDPHKPPSLIEQLRQLKAEAQAWEARNRHSVAGLVAKLAGILEQVVLADAPAPCPQCGAVHPDP